MLKVVETTEKDGENYNDNVKNYFRNRNNKQKLYVKKHNNNVMKIMLKITLIM